MPGRNFQSAGGLSTSFEQVTTAEGKPKKVSLDAGDNPPDGVLINYHLTEEPKDPITLRILDGEGNLVREFTSKEPDEKEFKDNPGRIKPPVVPAKQGGNRFVWDLRYPNATEVPDDTGSMGFARGATGPKAAPGSYQVEIVNGRTTLTQQFALLPDARTGSTASDYREGFELAMQVRDKLSELHEGVNKMRRRPQASRCLVRAAG